MAVSYLGKVTGFMSDRTLRDLTGVSAGYYSNADITWLKFKVGTGEVLVANKNVGWGMTWNDINKAGCVFGKVITINEHKYRCRLLKGGTGDPAIPDTSEWKQFIVDLVPNAADSNWGVSYTLCQEDYYKNAACVVRGKDSISYVGFVDKGYVNNTHGWRPVLEKLVDIQVTGVPGDLGAITSFSDFQYTVTNKNGDTFDIIEKIDGNTIRTFTNQTNGTNYTFTLGDFTNIPFGKHKVEIVAIDPQCEDNITLTFTFTRVKNPVQALPEGATLKQITAHSKELAQEVDYQKYMLLDKLKQAGLDLDPKLSLSKVIDNVDIGKKWAKGEGSTNSRDFFNGIEYYYYDLNVANLNFRPSTIVLLGSSTNGSTVAVYNSTPLNIMFAGRTSSTSGFLGIGSTINLPNGNIRLPFSIKSDNYGVANVQWIAYE